MRPRGESISSPHSWYVGQVGRQNPQCTQSPRGQPAQLTGDRSAMRSSVRVIAPSDPSGEPAGCHRVPRVELVLDAPASAAAREGTGPHISGQRPAPRPGQRTDDRAARAGGPSHAPHQARSTIRSSALAQPRPRTPAASPARGARRRRRRCSDARAGRACDDGESSPVVRAAASIAASTPGSADSPEATPDHGVPPGCGRSAGPAAPPGRRVATRSRPAPEQPAQSAIGPRRDTRPRCPRGATPIQTAPVRGAGRLNPRRPTGGELEPAAAATAFSGRGRVGEARRSRTRSRRAAGAAGRSPR